MKTCLWDGAQKTWEAPFLWALFIPVSKVAPLLLLDLEEHSGLALSWGAGAGHPGMNTEAGWVQVECSGLLMGRLLQPRQSTGYPPMGDWAWRPCTGEPLLDCSSPSLDIVPIRSFNHLWSIYHVLGKAPDTGAAMVGTGWTAVLWAQPSRQPDVALVPLPCRHSSLPWGRQPTLWPPCSSYSSSWCTSSLSWASACLGFQREVTWITGGTWLWPSSPSSAWPRYHVWE